MSVPHPLHRYGCRCGIISHALLRRGPAQRTQRIHLLCPGQVTSRVSSFPVHCSVLCPQVIGLVYRPYVVVQSNSSSTDVSCSWLAVWSCVHRGRSVASVVQTQLWQYSPRAGQRVHVSTHTSRSHIRDAFTQYQTPPNSSLIAGATEMYISALSNTFITETQSTETAHDLHCSIELCVLTLTNVVLYEPVVNILSIIPALIQLVCKHQHCCILEISALYPAYEYTIYMYMYIGNIGCFPAYKHNYVVHVQWNTFRLMNIHMYVVHTHVYWKYRHFSSL